MIFLQNFFFRNPEKTSLTKTQSVPILGEHRICSTVSEKVEEPWKSPKLFMWPSSVQEIVESSKIQKVPIEHSCCCSRGVLLITGLLFDIWIENIDAVFCNFCNKKCQAYFGV